MTVALLELGVGRYEAALDAALEAQALWPLLSPEDAVEAAMRCDRSEVGQAAFDDFAPLVVGGGMSWALGVMARCRALLAGDDPRAGNDYQQAVEYFQDIPVVLSLARFRLVYGEWLRRQRRRRDARDQLHPQETQIARLAAGGVPDRDIATRLFLTMAIVDYHLRAICRRFGVTRRASLLRALLDVGLEV